ncbi:hypothetical protein [Anaerosporobacter sp.]|uniref:hypothetical protein n=1 Tax=Anaerosporobacter sp. TaxID=1872529 RepID=UPI00286EEAB5|nr:hypothetical protein [Anaerosporobacter sp.]
MLFSKKATKVLDEQTELLEEREKKREERENADEKERLQWKDVLAMMIAGIITFVPAILFVCAIFGFFIWFFFIRFF